MEFRIAHYTFDAVYTAGQWAKINGSARVKLLQLMEICYIACIPESCVAHIVVAQLRVKLRVEQSDTINTIIDKIQQYYIAFLVHVNHIGIPINHSKIQFNMLFSLAIQFNKIEIKTHFQNFIIKCAFTLINCVV